MIAEEGGEARPEPTTVILPGLPLEIHEGYSPMNLTQVLASGESDKYELTWVRIIPVGIKLWIKDKETGKTVRTAVFNEHNLLKAIADAALAQIEEPRKRVTGDENVQKG
ncbi:MAG TPA: hypothetical protein VK735_40065 [Pseudonocardia sp.]|uniref:hypothetical protein n=1 Tax=Pseudonocardia sp. TaxID=60912 RepID=UPI002BF7C98B|nr:hypothetical protein [Pseudonocardia sp.]HTF53681.1 hypothetical protein [Pseudonocardia sp.]